MQIALLRFFKTFQNYLAYVFLGLFIPLLRFLLAENLLNVILFAIYFVTAIIR